MLRQLWFLFLLLNYYEHSRGTAKSQPESGQGVKRTAGRPHRKQNLIWDHRQTARPAARKEVTLSSKKRKVGAPGPGALKTTRTEKNIKGQMKVAWWP
jgi:hypothetical protein